jgi:hypothetical protein
MIKKLIFGKKAQGEKLPEPKPIIERPLDAAKFQKWCKELRVSSAYVKRYKYFHNG